MFHQDTFSISITLPVSITWLELLELLERWGKELLSGQYLPITVTAAIALFLVKELLEIRRRRGERLRKITAVKLLLSQELEKNYWALVSFFRILTTIKDAEDFAPRAVFRLHIARDGSEHFRMKEEPEEKNETGQAIPTFRADIYEKHLATLAEYDQDLYNVVSETYGEIFELVHYRETLASFLAGESMAPVNSTRHFLSEMAAEKDDYYNALNKTYLALTGNNLEQWQLR